MAEYSFLAQVNRAYDRAADLTGQPPTLLKPIRERNHVYCSKDIVGVDAATTMTVQRFDLSSPRVSQQETADVG